MDTFTKVRKQIAERKVVKDSKTFRVTIRATVTKTIEVEASTENEAVMAAHSEFTATCDSDEENYDAEILNIEEV